jgi:hypothetical protein
MSKHTLGSGPIEQRYHDEMNKLAHFLDHYFNAEAQPPATRTTGFVLLVFPFGGDGRCNYISNAQRADIVTMLREQLSYFEGMPDDQKGGRA